MTFLTFEIATNLYRHESSNYCEVFGPSQGGFGGCYAGSGAPRLPRDRNRYFTIKNRCEGHEYLY